MAPALLPFFFFILLEVFASKPRLAKPYAVRLVFHQNAILQLFVLKHACEQGLENRVYVVGLCSRGLVVVNVINDGFCVLILSFADAQPAVLLQVLVRLYEFVHVFLAHLPLVNQVRFVAHDGQLNIFVCVFEDFWKPVLVHILKAAFVGHIEHYHYSFDTPELMASQLPELFVASCVPDLDLD